MWVARSNYVALICLLELTQTNRSEILCRKIDFFRRLTIPHGTITMDIKTLNSKFQIMNAMERGEKQEKEMPESFSDRFDSLIKLIKVKS